MTYSISQQQAGSLEIHSNGIEASLEEVGVSVGGKTTRERLLDLLSRHVKAKKPRISSQNTSRIRSKKEKARREDAHKKKEIETGSLNRQNVSNTTVDYSIFQESMLVDMLRTVGVDPKGFDKEKLVQTCRTYSDLCESQM